VQKQAANPGVQIQPTILLVGGQLLQPAMMALRRLSLRAPKGVRQMSGHSIEEAIGA